MTPVEIAVIRVRPCCPVCGKPLDPPDEVMDTRRPTTAYFGLVCACGQWQGLGKFWLRQRDEVQ